MKVTYDLDILKPHMPPVDLVARTLMEVEGILKVHIKVDELDQKTASLHISIEGYDIELENVIDVLGEMNCALHSVDEVIVEKEG
ncbi:MAG: DUF211 domain-containing protein [Promethearchaeota archaeon]